MIGSSTYGNKISVIPSKYGFAENFEDSQYSQQSEDQIIVEPLVQETQAINHEKSMRLTGQYYHETAEKSAIHQMNKYNPQQQSNKPNSIVTPQKYTQPKVQSSTQQYNKRVEPQLISQNPRPIQQTYNPQQPYVAPKRPQQQELRQSIHQTPITYTSPQFQEESIEVKSDISQRKKSNNDLQSRHSIQKPQEKEHISANERKNQIQQQKQALQQVDYLQVKQSPSKYNGADICELFAVQNGKITLSNDANKILSHIDDEVAIVSIAGMHKSGKSTLFNQMLNITGKTKFGHHGVWMYSTPVKVEGRSLLFIDCTSDDSIAIYLVFLISSLLLYNTSKGINDQSITSLVNFDKHTHQLQSVQALTQIMPQLIWVQRDTLQALPFIQLTEYLNKKPIGDAFDQVIKQKDIYAIAPSGTSEYNQQLKQLQQRIMFGVAAKSVNGVPLNGHMMYSYLEYMAQILSMGQQFNPDQLWNIISEDETKQLFNQSVGMYHQLIDGLIKDNKPKTHQTLLNTLYQFREQCIYETFFKAMFQNKNKHYMSYKTKLLEVLNQKERLMLSYASNLSELENETLLEQLIKPISGKEQGAFIREFDNMLKHYENKGYEMEMTSAFAEIMHKHYREYIYQLAAGFQQNNQEAESAKNAGSEAVYIEKEEYVKKMKENIKYTEHKNALCQKQIVELKEQIELEKEESANQGNNADHDDQVFKLKQGVQARNKEIQELKKQINLEVQRKQDSGCIIF